MSYEDGFPITYFDVEHVRIHRVPDGFEAIIDVESRDQPLVVGEYNGGDGLFEQLIRGGEIDL